MMMKTNIMKHLILFAVIALSLGCADLNQEPEGALTSSNPISSVSELQKYVNQFYEETFRIQPANLQSAGIAFDDQYSDNMACSSVPSLLDGTRSVSSAASPAEYTKIRSLNFLFANINNCKGNQADIDQYTGEAYFFRAYYYFNMVCKYGDITWIDRVLDASSEQMKLKRDSRADVINHILSDLDNAINLLNTKSNSSTMRLHKDVALAFKSRVALFEGTWQKYHKAKNDPFFTAGITDARINNYLEQARDAALAIIQSGRWKIYSTSNPLTDYKNLFITKDLSTNSEVLFWKKYDAKVVGNNVTRYCNKGGGNIGLTLSLVNDYLTRDGRIFTGAERDEAQKKYGKELDPALRDPRLCQTVARPGERLRPLTSNAAYIYMPEFSPIITEVALPVMWANPTGYSLLKFIEVDCTDAAADDELKGECPAIQFRYAEVLLNYAEALAELEGASAQEKIAKALQPLRDRVGMPGIDFQREYNTDPDYPFHHLEATIQVVRRERRIELACEGIRMFDIFRWAAADILIANKEMLGALFTGSNMEAANTAGGYFKGNLIYDKPTGNNLYLSGKPGDTKRYISPYKGVCPNGLTFNVNRDYLYPISLDEIALTGNMWKQNPGW